MKRKMEGGLVKQKQHFYFTAKYFMGLKKGMWARGAGTEYFTWERTQHLGVSDMPFFALVTAL